MGWESNNIFQVLIITGSTGSGVFVYSPSPGLGNLIASITSGPGVDPYGNAYLAEITAYDTGARHEALQLSGDGLTWLTAPSSAGPYTGRGQLLDGNTGSLQLGGFDLDITTAGKGLQIAEGANARMGLATLAAGTVVVANTSVTANTRIFAFHQTSGPNAGFLTISARVAGTSFTILSSNAADANAVAWLLVEPG